MPVVTAGSSLCPLQFGFLTLSSVNPSLSSPGTHQSHQPLPAPVPAALGTTGILYWGIQDPAPRPGHCWNPVLWDLGSCPTPWALLESCPGRFRILFCAPGTAEILSWGIQDPAPCPGHCWNLFLKDLASCSVLGTRLEPIPEGFRILLCAGEPLEALPVGFRILPGAVG